MNYVLGLEYVQSKIDARKRDCLRCTPIFHDAIKCGTSGSQYTVHEHPMLAGEWVRNTVVEHDIDTETKAYIARLCESHSGQWTSTKEVLLCCQSPKMTNSSSYICVIIWQAGQIWICSILTK